MQIIEAINPSTLAKSRKTDAEAHHIRHAMEQDGAALAEFFSWFEAALGHETITEMTVGQKVVEARERRPGYVCPSFHPIAGFNANGALPHYRATEDAHATICMRGTIGNGLLLIDSGGQYEYGTTDITRVVPVGQTTAEQRRDYTLVLKGMIALSVAKFPRGTRSPMLDTLARAPIWAAGVDFGHGTGHGVGYFLNVHEGPHGITPHLPPEPQTAMEPGMVTSNEPGIYRPGRWGVRIENLVLNVPATLKEPSEFGEFLQFETLTLSPIDTRVIERSLLRDDEVKWLNAYHAEVRRRVGPHVSGAAAAWLQLRTEADLAPTRIATIARFVDGAVAASMDKRAASGGKGSKSGKSKAADDKSERPGNQLHPQHHHRGSGTRHLRAAPVGRPSRARTTSMRTRRTIRQKSVRAFRPSPTAICTSATRSRSA